MNLLTISRKSGNDGFRIKNIEDSDSYNSEADSKVEEDFDNEVKSVTEENLDKKDVKGISVIHEMSKLIEVGEKLGRDESERYGSECLRTQAHIFNSFIDAAGLFDIPLGGRMFTWMNKADTNMSKLDQFLISHSVMDSSSDFKVTALPRGWSDHTLSLLHYEKDDYGPVPSKFFLLWLQRDDFNDCIVMRILNVCKVSRMHEVCSRLNAIDGNIDSGIASVEEKHDRLNLIKECDDIQKLEEMDTVQKARVKWDIEGDENSKFFC
ncbi:RNA-directed DNA polymerase, eukaryota, reverse transcriptase zinc-binding domain protein [Tanacetum coccineum]